MKDNTYLLLNNYTMILNKLHMIILMLWSYKCEKHFTFEISVIIQKKINLPGYEFVMLAAAIGYFILCMYNTHSILIQIT